MQIKTTLLAFVISGALLSSCGSEGSISTIGGSKKKDSTLKLNTIDDTVTKKKPLTTAVENANQDAINYTVPENTKEIMWLKAANERGVHKDVRASALIMLGDHLKFGNKLKDIIQKGNYTIPAFDTTNEVNINDKIGIDWDKAWAGKMVADHMEFLKLLQKAAKDVTDTSLKNLISSDIPIIQSHLTMAEQISKKIK
ncbi:MAG: hypothetical protein NVS3B19_06390 [Ginsengibacter sp.]